MPTHLPLLYVVVLNWNNPMDTLHCLECVARSSYPQLQIVVVDNGSSDDSVVRIRTAFPDYTLLQNRTNLGYASGNNSGIHYSLKRGADYVVLLNNDAFVKPDTLSSLVLTAESDVTIAAAGCKVPFYDTPYRLWAAGEAFPHGLYPLDDGRFDTPRDITYAAGCCILMRRVALEQIGLLDPRFFCYFEEQDWCLRATNAGYRIVYVPEAVVYHRVAASSGGFSPLYHYLFVRNYLYMSEKHGRVGLHIWRIHDALLVWLRELLRIMMAPGPSRLRRAWAATRGALDFFYGRFGVPPTGL